MTRQSSASAVAASTLALLALLGASAASAQTATRAWVSGHGTDTAGCGAPTTPCRSLQFTHDNAIAAGGEIDVLDPAGYGSITITKAISIINDGVGTAGVQATGGNAITINAGASDPIVLHGLTIEGVGATNGIVFNSGGALSVEDSAIARFSFANLIFSPSSASYLYVSHTRLRDISSGGGLGIYIHPLITSGTPIVRATLEHVEVVNDAQGVFIDGRQMTHGATLMATIADSLLADNATGGIHGLTNDVAGTILAMVRDTTIANNGFGIFSQGGAQVFLDRSTVSGNDQSFAADSAGIIGSYGDNSVDLNGSGGASATVPEMLR